ncbi:MAG: hypothetical protein IT499_19005 [Rubrivivax sp.]|nr:hypothetical protein [Rubrivivax sp.]MCL4695824.1 hypothetical protein [Burkholderiaceae bacterium]
MSFTDIVLAAGARTPFGDFGKSLRDVPLCGLGVHVVKASLARAGLAGAQVDHFVFGNTAPVDHDGLFVSRKIALLAGLRKTARRSASCAPAAPARRPSSARRSRS